MIINLGLYTFDEQEDRKQTEKNMLKRKFNTSIDQVLLWNDPLIEENWLVIAYKKLLEMR